MGRVSDGQGAMCNLRCAPRDSGYGEGKPRKAGASATSSHLSAKCVEYLVKLRIGFGKRYPPIPSLRERRIYAANAAVQRRARSCVLMHRFVDRRAYMCLTARTLAMTGKNAHRFVDRRAYMCLTARTLAMTGKNAHRFVDRWPRQCQRHLHKGAMCNLRCAPRDSGYGEGKPRKAGASATSSHLSAKCVEYLVKLRIGLG